MCVCVRACVRERARVCVCVHALLSPAPTDAQNLLGQVVRDAGTQFCPFPFRSVKMISIRTRGPSNRAQERSKGGRWSQLGFRSWTD